MAKRVLVTGGTGYIGSHTAVQLIEKGFEPLIIDNLSNSTIEIIDRIKKITGKQVYFEKIEMCNLKELSSFFSKQKQIEAVIHFAAFLQVNESVQNPLMYYENNIVSTINLLQCMHLFGIENMVFSSSCTVYGTPDKLPVDETSPIKPAASPYGNTKKICEDIIHDFSNVSDIQSISLRYFNPVGAHHSALIGEVQSGEPHHLVPYITETAFGKRDFLKIFGDDYNTPDGTCIRDYIHVVDLADAHISSIERLLKGETQNYEVFNVGTGIGYSVLDVVKDFENINGIKIKYKITNRRDGDVEAVYADTTLANTKLGWKSKKNLEEMMHSSWEWEKSVNKNPIKF